MDELITLQGKSTQTSIINNDGQSEQLGFGCLQVKPTATHSWSNVDKSSPSQKAANNPHRVLLSYFLECCYAYHACVESTGGGVCNVWVCPGAILQGNCFFFFFFRLSFFILSFSTTSFFYPKITIWATASERGGEIRQRTEQSHAVILSCLRKLRIFHCIASISSIPSPTHIQLVYQPN